MNSIVLHGKGSSPSKVEWLSTPLRRFGTVEVPDFDYDVEQGLEIVLRKDFHLVAGHSRGGTVALLAGARRFVPVIAVSAPTDRILQLEHLSRFPEDSEQGKLYRYLSTFSRERLIETSPITYASSLRNVLLIHGENDDVVPIIHSERLCEKVREAGNECNMVRLNMRHSPPKHLYREIEDIVVKWVQGLCEKRILTCFT
ncbi:prolyl oligopeptidase family serine peptidase [Metallosphaera javensis (ex Sakai et al. 2022)]|uniref:alpha/beta hydrolase family protein n=1 Tax=Metallosphaera javensis (ex Sakai et al. 2022) TaxID=2775498 RepID=UPI002590CEA8